MLPKVWTITRYNQQKDEHNYHKVTQSASLTAGGAELHMLLAWSMLLYNLCLIKCWCYSQLWHKRTHFPFFTNKKFNSQHVSLSQTAKYSGFGSHKQWVINVYTGQTLLPQMCRSAPDWNIYLLMQPVYLGTLRTGCNINATTLWQAIWNHPLGAVEGPKDLHFNYTFWFTGVDYFHTLAAG